MGYMIHTSNAHLSIGDLNGGIGTRRFDPAKMYLRPLEPDEVEVPWSEEWTCVACYKAERCSKCKKMAVHINSIIVAVDGACRGNGTSHAKAAAAVYFGPQSAYNVARVLNSPDPTNQKAELEAGIIALERALAISKNERFYSYDDDSGALLETVVVKTDSEYLAKGMSEWVLKWEQNGYINSRGLPVLNASLFRTLQSLAAELEERDVKVLFWHVPRHLNKKADQMANNALDGKPI
ncbi:hypothetical protein ASPZODRAFT_129958 [Penicilliopsis zonata CBS 506.65]|uniref:ribonuclease H n=1 Tax=Penicilliopsis zonata CBS 506.65 TaxID=1073090 RepID=A0A1L9SQI4_9EURO|nr:hypothetical protein ASPZODRAFT_129958 [Penicilliopsis zonata CBS 506.65]OJJ49480.1 hypothetical protein ASPZODRAFT_129958 [Penicilliopsis zonata CBS 506.65]